MGVFAVCSAAAVLRPLQIRCKLPYPPVPPLLQRIRFASSVSAAQYRYRAESLQKDPHSFYFWIFCRTDDQDDDQQKDNCDDGDKDIKIYRIRLEIFDHFFPHGQYTPILFFAYMVI